MADITMSVAAKSSCPFCGNVGHFTYSPLNRHFICGKCGETFARPILPGQA